MECQAITARRSVARIISRRSNMGTTIAAGQTLGLGQVLFALAPSTPECTDQHNLHALSNLKSERPILKQCHGRFRCESANGPDLHARATAGRAGRRWPAHGRGRPAPSSRSRRALDRAGLLNPSGLLLTPSPARLDVAPNHSHLGPVKVYSAWRLLSDPSKSRRRGARPRA